MLSMENYMDQLRNLSAETENVEQQATNRWRILTFNGLATRENMEWDHEEDIHTDSLFRNSAVHIPYESSKDICLDEKETMTTI